MTAERPALSFARPLLIEDNERQAGCPLSTTSRHSDGRRKLHGRKRPAADDRGIDDSCYKRPCESETKDQDVLLFALWFTREYEHRQDTELSIGIYSSREEAEAVIARLREKPGFKEYPEGFEIHDTHVGLTGWEEGFVTTYGDPPKGAASEAFDLPAWMFDKR